MYGQGGAAGGSLAAAVLGIGTVTKSSASQVAATGTSAHATKVAGAVAQQLAHTGASSTVALMLLAMVLLIAGLLFVSLARRHAPPGARSLRHV